jgi:hypothetical protein
MCTKPPACVLFQQEKPRSTIFQDLDPSVVPIFPIERSITLKGFSVRRKQVPVCPAFCLTDYKVQGSTLTKAILDLKDNPATRGLDRHRKYCSLYVQLSRIRSLGGLHLLQKLEKKDIQIGPDPRLLAEMERLQTLENRLMNLGRKRTKHQVPRIILKYGSKLQLGGYCIMTCDPGLACTCSLILLPNSLS